MDSRSAKAVSLHQNGYSCSQAVFCAYADLVGLDEQTAYKIAEGFGSGMGGLGHTCGAVSAMFLLAGLKNSSGIPGDKSTRPGTYQLVREFSKAFEEKNGSTQCAVLKGSDGKPRLRSCPGCVEDAAVLVGRLFEK